MTKTFGLNDITADAIRLSGGIYATDGSESILIRKNLKLPPFTSRNVEAPTSPEPLYVHVESLSVENLKKVRSRLEELGIDNGLVGLDE